MVAGTLPVLRRVATLAGLFRRNIYPTSQLSCPLARFASLTCNFISPSLSCSSPEDEDRNKSDPGHRRAHPGQVFLIPLFPRWQSLAVPTRRLLDQGKRCSGFFTFCREVITAGNRNKEAPLGILLVLSPSCSLRGICLFCPFSLAPLA